MRSCTISVVVALSTGWLGSACLRPSESRAERDQAVGRESRAGVSVEVAGGLAAIRQLEAGRIQLWAGAPSLEVALQRTGDGPAQWQLTVDNCLPDARLTLEASAPVDRAWSSILTRGEWQLPLARAERVVAHIRSPRAEQEGSFRFAILSDIQESMGRVGEVFARMNQEEDLAFVVSTGDLTDQGSAEQLVAFQRQLGKLHVPFFSTLGNHELFTSGPPFHHYFGRGNFHFEYRGVRFTLLDSASGTLDPIVYDWLDDWLARGRQQLHIVGMHVPPIDPVGLRNGSFASRNEAALLLAEFAAADVDMLFFGHLHSYYHYQLAGIEAHVSGGGGAIPEQFDGIGRHFLVVEVDPASEAWSTRVVRVE